MKLGHRFEFPPEQQQLRRRARRLAWLSIALLLSAAAFMAMTLGQSQALKTAWIGDLLGVIPPISLLVAMHYEQKTPTHRFPYGYFRSITVAFLITATSLLFSGIWLLYDGALKLVTQHHPPIGTMELFGRQLWAGWPMCVTLAYSACVGLLLGHLKRPVGEKLHDKVLEADADTNKADWMSEVAAIVGIVLVGFGFWWGDGAAAVFISINIILDGWKNLRQVVADLMDESPSEMGETDLEELPRKLREAVERMDWVADAAVRLREHGHVLLGDVFVVPKDETNLVARVERASEELKQLDWRLYALTVVPVAELEGDGTVPKS